MLFGKLVDCVDAVMEAATMSKNWVLVDRRSSTSSSSTGELFLEHSLSQRPKETTVLALHDVDHFRGYFPSYCVNQQLIALMELLSEARRPGADKLPLVKLQRCYTAAEFLKWYGQQEEHSFYLPRTPDSEDMLIGETGWQTEGKQEDRCKQFKVPEAVKWMYHYEQFLFPAATHYIIFENSSSTSMHFATRPGSEWSQCAVHANGGNKALARIQDMLSSGNSAFLLHNTGGVSQTFASLYKMCCKKTAIYKKVDSKEKEEFAWKKKLLQKVDLIDDEPWSVNFGMDTIDFMTRLQDRAPEVFCQNVKTFNVLEDTAETLVDKLTQMLAKSTRGLPEVGVAGADSDVVLMAWGLAIGFWTAASDYKGKQDKYFMLGSSLSVLAVLLVVLTTDPLTLEAIEVQALPNISWAPWTIGSVFRGMLLVLPVISAALGTLVSERRCLNKWASCYAHSWALIGEIYKFRCKVDEYSPMMEENDVEDEETALMSGGSKPRDRFVANVHELYETCRDELQEDAAEFDEGGKLSNVWDKEGEHMLRRRIRTFVRDQMLSGCFPRPPKTRWSAALKWLCLCHWRYPPDPSLSASGEEEEANKMECHPDEYISPLTIETYLKDRLEPLLKLSQKAVGPLSKNLRNIRCTAVLLTSLGAILVMVDQASWIAFTVALVAAVSHGESYYRLSDRLKAHNANIREHHCRKCRDQKQWR